MQQVSLYFNTKTPRKRVSKTIIQFVYCNYYGGKSARKIADVFCLEIRRLDLKAPSARTKKVTQKCGRKIIKKERNLQKCF